ncbi:hypothetical protein FQZ97_974920 [compost metagenome]
MLVPTAGQLLVGHLDMEGAQQRPHHHPHVFQRLGNDGHACGRNHTEMELTVEQRSLLGVYRNRLLERLLDLLQVLELLIGNTLGGKARRLPFQMMTDELDFPQLLSGELRHIDRGRGLHHQRAVTDQAEDRFANGSDRHLELLRQPGNAQTIPRTILPVHEGGANH